MKDKVSFLLPISNNQIKYHQSIKSIFDQNHKNFEVLIGLNGNSKRFDNELIKKYGSNNRIKIFQLPKKNIVLALNLLIKKSRGYYIARIDADDIIFENRIIEQLAYIKKKKIDIVSSNGEVFINNKFSYNHKTIFLKCLYTNPILHPSILSKKEIFKKSKYYNIPYAEDYDLYLRLFLEGKKFGNISKNLIRYNVNVHKIKNKKLSYFVLLSTLIIAKGFRDKLRVNPNFFKNIKVDIEYFNSHQKYAQLLLNNNILNKLLFFCYLSIFGHKLIKKNILNFIFYKFDFYQIEKVKKKKIPIKYNPLISFVIPTYNSEKTIVETLKSVLSQTYLNIEVIIVDNSPNNKTINEIHKNFKKKNNIKIVRIQKHILQGEARNIGVRNTSKLSEFISFCDSDDILKKDKTKIQLLKMQKENAEISFTNADYYDVKKKVYHKSKITYPFLDINFNDLCFKNRIITSSVIVSKKLFLSVDGFPESNYFYSYEDYFLWLKIAQKSKIYFLDESLLIYYDNRSHSSSSRSRHIIDQRFRLFMYFLGRMEIKKCLSIINGNFKLLKSWIEKKYFKKNHNEYINLL